MPLQNQKKEYTIEDIYALPDGVRAELIDGRSITCLRQAGSIRKLQVNYLPLFATTLNQRWLMQALYRPICSILNEDDKNTWNLI